MGGTGDRSGEPSPARCGPVASSRRRGGERKGAPAAQPDRHLSALPDSCRARYRSLGRLAVSPAGDANADRPRTRCPCPAVSQPQISAS
jgi:hypothetical protein